jgi:hypothetical protein
VFVIVAQWEDLPDLTAADETLVLVVDLPLLPVLLVVLLLGDPVDLAEVVEIPLVVGKGLETDLAGEAAAVVPGVLAPAAYPFLGARWGALKYDHVPDKNGYRTGTGWTKCSNQLCRPGTIFFRIRLLRKFSNWSHSIFC